MNRKIFLSIIFLVQSVISFSQITSSVVEYYSSQAKGLVMNYYSALNLICGNQLQNDEKGIIINETINLMFENDQVFVCNDVDLTNTTQTNFKIKEYPENIRLYFNNSEISFDVNSFKLSDVFKAKEFYFYKAEVTREMTISFNGIKRTDSTHLDFYIKFIPNKLNCQIYSIKKHENNLNQFKIATIEKIPTSTIIIIDDKGQSNKENPNIKKIKTKSNSDDYLAGKNDALRNYKYTKKAHIIVGGCLPIIGLPITITDAFFAPENYLNESPDNKSNDYYEGYKKGAHNKKIRKIFIQNMRGTGILMGALILLALIQ